MNRRQSNNLPHEFEKAYDEYECQEIIKDALDAMKKYQNKFTYTSTQPFIGHKEQMLRNSIYLRFNCANCTNGKKKKRFTSIMGSVSIYFQLQKQGPRQKYPYKLVFNLQIYRMRCLGCGRYGEAEIYDSQLQKRIEKPFCRIIANMIDQVPRKRNRNKRPIREPDLHNHRHEQCEACQIGKCHPPYSCKKAQQVRESQLYSDSD